MTRRIEHNIESNCVSFDDDCYNETNNYQADILQMEQVEFAWIKNTGTRFVEYLNKILKGN